MNEVKNSFVTCVTCLFYVRSIEFYLHHNLVKLAFEWLREFFRLSSVREGGRLQCNLLRRALRFKGTFLKIVVKVHKIPILCYNISNWQRLYATFIKNPNFHLVNETNLLHNFLNIFIAFLYMFRATICPSSGEVTYLCETWYLSLNMDDWLVCRAKFRLHTSQSSI